MNSLRKWIFKPKKSDSSLLAQFYYADEDLNAVAAELDSFDGRKEPERCTLLINKLRSCQDKLLCIVEKVMQEAIPSQRANRDFRVKFPDDVMQENLAGQLWFGAECLAAGSSIMNREVESASMRPLARTLTRHLDHMRQLLREQSLKINEYSQQIKTGLVLFDKLFAEFELSYVSAMVPVKTMRDYDMLQQVMVLFSETVQRAVMKKLITTDMIDSYDPALMFTIPRLAIVCGLHVYPEGPVNPDMDPTNMSEMFRPFQTLLYKIRELLSTLTDEELKRLEKALCSTDEPPVTPIDANVPNSDASGPVFPISSNLTAIPVCAQRDSDSDPEYSSADALSTSSSSGASANDDSVQSEASVTSSQKDATSLASGSDLGARPKEGGSKKRMAHQESKDSGMPSEPDVNNQFADNLEYFEKQEVTSYRLRHSKSWPNAKRRKSATKQSSGSELSDIGASGGGVSLDLIDTPDVDSISDEEYNTNPLNSRARSSHEFTFSIPADTSLPSSSSPIIPTEGEYADIVSDTKLNDAASAPNSPHHGNHVSFVTEALNDTFLTDPLEANEVTCLCCADVSNESTNQNEEQLLNSSEQNRRSDNAQSSVAGSSSSSNVDPKTPFECDTHVSLTQESGSSDAQPIKTENMSKPSNTCDKCNCSPTTKTNHDDSSSNKKQSYTTNVCDKCEMCSKCSASKRNNAVNSANEPVPSEPTKISPNTRAEVKNNKPIAQAPERRYFRSHSCPCKPTLAANVYRRTMPKTTEEHQESRKGRKTDQKQLNTSHSSRSTYSDSDSSSSASECGAAGTGEEENDEISLAIRAAEAAARQEARARFASSDELIHRLFVCISGVADQLQTNYAADLRHILKCVFECNASDPLPEEETCSDKSSTDTFVNISAPESPNSSLLDDENTEPREGTERGENNNRTNAQTPPDERDYDEPPSWVPDEEAADCYSCKVPFTFVRRRHHCRNCGKVFCGRCSSNSVPLPQFGHQKPVRVCNRCFMFHVTPFTVEPETASH